jgi:hypothetical protein
MAARHLSGAGAGMLDNYLAIKQLEEAVIPWHNQGHGAPSRRLREAAAANPLAAAEGLLRRGPRPGAAGARGRGPIAHASASWQNETLVRWARNESRLIHRQLEDRLVSIGGVEHDVFHDQSTGRWVKITRPGKGGKELHAWTEGAGVRPTLATEDATPAAYLHRLVLANAKLGDDFWLHGIIDAPGGPRFVVSQRDVGGEPATPAEIARHFVTAGFVQVNAKTFYHPKANLLVSDAHRANVFKTSMGIVPFDVGVQQPKEDLLLAVRPAAVLNFDEERVQPRLEF